MTIPEGKYFPKMPFYFQNFSKMPCFPDFSLGFPEVPSFYLLCSSFSKNAFFFQADCTFLLSCSELPREIIFSLLLEVFIDQLLMPS